MEGDSKDGGDSKQLEMNVKVAKVEEVEEAKVEELEEAKVKEIEDAKVKEIEEANVVHKRILEIVKEFRAISDRLKEATEEFKKKYKVYYDEEKKIISFVEKEIGMKLIIGTEKKEMTDEEFTRELEKYNKSQITKLMNEMKDALEANLRKPGKKWLAKVYPLDALSVDSDDSNTAQMMKIHQITCKRAEQICGVHERHRKNEKSQKDGEERPGPSTAFSLPMEETASTDTTDSYSEHTKTINQMGDDPESEESLPTQPPTVAEETSGSSSSLESHLLTPEEGSSDSIPRPPYKPMYIPDEDSSDSITKWVEPIPRHIYDTLPREEKDLYEKFWELCHRLHKKRMFFKELPYILDSSMNSRHDMGDFPSDDMANLIDNEKCGRYLEKVVGTICVTERILRALEADKEKPGKAWLKINYPLLLRDPDFDSNDSNAEQLKKIHQRVSKQNERMLGFYKGREKSYGEEWVKLPEAKGVSINTVIQRIEEMMKSLLKEIRNDVEEAENFVKALKTATWEPGESDRSMEEPGPSCSMDESQARHEVKLEPEPDSPTSPPRKKKKFVHTRL